MAILASAGDSESMGLPEAIFFGLMVVVMPQLAALNYCCSASKTHLRRFHRWALLGALFGGLALLVLVLHRYGAREVRADYGAILLLTAGGGILQIGAIVLFPWLGLSLRDDAMERHNTAALVALLGALVAVQLAYAGGNIGEGPSYWNNVFSAGLATGGLLCLWLVLQAGANVAASIAEDRDLASGVRFGGFMVASGLILGRAVAGDWHSESATVHDFVHDGWPAAALCVLALALERGLRPSRRRPFPSWPACGLLPALLYLAFAGAWLCHLGPWEGFVK